MSELDDLGHELVLRYRNMQVKMATLGLHVGMGTPVTCVSCRTPWPCEASSR